MLRGLWWWLVLTHVLIGLNDSRRNGLDIKLDDRLVRTFDGAHRDNIQLVWTVDHHESRGYARRELANATTVDFHTPVWTQLGPLPGSRWCGGPIGCRA